MIAYDGPAQVSVPTIVIDHEKCTTPMACRRCLEICPQAVFIARVVKMVKYQETDVNQPGAYKLKAYFPDKCVACDDCVKACPTNALTIRVQEA